MNKKQNKYEVIYKNKKGLTMERKNYGDKSEVRVRQEFIHEGTHTVAKYKFKNITNYYTPYLNWENLSYNSCWAYSEEDLFNQFASGNKLFAQIVINMNRKEEIKIIDKIEKLKLSDDSVIVTEIKHWTDYCRMFILSRKGCVSDYIDVKKVLSDYYRLGLWELSKSELLTLMNMVDTNMENFAHEDLNEFHYDFKNPDGAIEYIFTGLLFGYPIESTADRLGL